MQVIVTSYRGPTNTRGSRIHARCLAKSLAVEYDDALDIEANHVRAARTLANRLGWAMDWTFGQLPNGDYAHVQARDFERWTNKATPNG